MTVNWFQLQQAQVVSLPVNHQSLCENAKLYEPGQRYIDFVRSLPTDGPRLESHSFDSAVTQNTASSEANKWAVEGYTHIHTHTASHLMMKSNSEPASMRTPSSVEIAPSTTGANMCSRATAERLFLLPIAVRKPCGGGEGGEGGGREEK